MMWKEYDSTSNEYKCRVYKGSSTPLAVLSSLDQYSDLIKKKE